MPRKLSVAFVALGLSAIGATKPKQDLSAQLMADFVSSLPKVEVGPFTEERALAMVTMPLACLDRPHALPETRTDYIWIHETKPRLVEAYDKNRAFYGCFDWHSAVNSTWTMVAVLKQFPKIAVGPLIREKLKDHLGKKNIQGEMDFLKDAKRFEIPYGYAWALKLYGELSTWDDPDAKTWSANMAPLAAQLSKKLVEYFNDLPLAVRSGMHPNTAFAVGLVLDYTDAVTDAPLREAAVKAATRFFGKDSDCPTAYEPAGTDFLSPCLAEARTMSWVLDRGAFALWLTDFFPALYSIAFKPLTEPVDVRGIKKDDLQGTKSHLVGLAFHRAEALLTIAAALPADDSRVTALRKIAAVNGGSGARAFADAGYHGSHWLGTYAVMYFRAAGR